MAGWYPSCVQRDISVKISSSAASQAHLSPSQVIPSGPGAVLVLDRKIESRTSERVIFGIMRGGTAGLSRFGKGGAIPGGATKSFSRNRLHLSACCTASGSPGPFERAGDGYSRRPCVHFLNLKTSAALALRSNSLAWNLLAFLIARLKTAFACFSPRAKSSGTGLVSSFLAHCTMRSDVVNHPVEYRAPPLLCVCRRAASRCRLLGCFR